MLHLVIITPVFAVDELDSISLPFMQIFCKELLRTNKVTLTIISEQYPTHDNYSWNGITVHTLKKNTPKFLYKFLRKYRLRKTLQNIHRTNRIDVVHNFWFNILGQISEKFSSEKNIRHLITLTGQDILPDNKYLPLITGYSGKLISPSEFHKNKLLENYKVDVRVIGWGIEPVKLTHAERSIDLIHCGWINSVKNNLQFLEIVNELKKTGSIKKVVICGGGPLFKELLADIQRLDLNDLIEIKNSIPRSEVLELMQKSKILVHTSHFESFGLVLAEGLACNCTVISTPVGIAFENKNIICCNSTEEFTAKIKAALQNFENNSEENIFEYPITKTVEEYIEVYKSL